MASETREPKIYVASTLFNGNDMTRQLVQAGVPVRGMIALGQPGTKAEISGYDSPSRFCEQHGIELIAVDSYGLSAEADVARLSQVEIDLLLILGWQRLIPGWLLERCRLGAIGVHGSASGITGGRGRSPQNWALMLGKQDFHLSIFFADAGIDSGAVIDSCRVPLSPWDDIYSSHLKVGRATVRMITANLANGRIARRQAAAQTGETRYLPQRRPEDGGIDWTRSSVEVHDFVRALSHPYPGAFSPFAAGTVRIWKARPCCESFREAHAPGEVVDVPRRGSALVATGDGLLLVEEYQVEETAAELVPGSVLESISFVGQLRRIVARHYAKYPELRISEDIEGLLKEQA